LVLYFWSCLKHCCARQALCDKIMLKCNKHLYFSCNKCRNSSKCNWSSYHFLTFFCTKLFFDNKHACCNRRVFLLCIVLLLLNWSWSWSWSYSFGLDLGLGLNILVLFPSLPNNHVMLSCTDVKCIQSIRSWSPPQPLCPGVTRVTCPASK